MTAYALSDISAFNKYELFRSSDMASWCKSFLTYRQVQWAGFRLRFHRYFWNTNDCKSCMSAVVLVIFSKFLTSPDTVSLSCFLVFECGKALTYLRLIYNIDRQSYYNSYILVYIVYSDYYDEDDLVLSPSLGEDNMNCV